MRRPSYLVDRRQRYRRKIVFDFLKRPQKTTRMVVVIKQSKETFIVQSSFYPRTLWSSMDYSCPVDQQSTLIQKVCKELIRANPDACAWAPIRCPDKPVQFSDDELARCPDLRDLDLYIIHTDQSHIIKTSEHCVALADDPLGPLLADRVNRSRIAKKPQAA